MVLPGSHRVVTTGWFNSWVIEASIDGGTRLEADGQDGYLGLKGGSIRSLTILRESQCLFIRIRQTAKIKSDSDHLVVRLTCSPNKRSMIQIVQMEAEELCRNPVPDQP
jgi:hypothetical protein